MSKIIKIISRLERKTIFLFDGINSKKYMKLYNSWLKRQGIQLNGAAKYIHHTAQLDGVDYTKIKIGTDVVISRDTLVLVHDFSIEAGLLSLNRGNPDNEARFIVNLLIQQL